MGTYDYHRKSTCLSCEKTSLMKIRGWGTVKICYNDGKEVG